MRKRIRLTVITTKGERNVNINVKSLLLPACTVRDKGEVEKHIEELEKIGVPAPRKMPIVYRVSLQLLTNGACMHEETVVKSGATSGEIGVGLQVKYKTIHLKNASRMRARNSLKGGLILV